MARQYHWLSRPLSILLILIGLNVQATEKQLLDRITVIVNDDIIVQSELNKAVEKLTREYLAKKQPLPDETTLRKQALDSLILKSIELQQAKKMGLKVTAVHIDQLLEKLAAQNKVTLAQLRQAIQAEGMDFQTFRKELGESYLINQLEQNVIRSRIQINEQDIDEEVKKIQHERNKNSKYRLHHFLLQSKSGDMNKLMQTAANIRQQLQQGKTLQEIKQQLDNDISLQDKDLGYLAADSLPDIFLDNIQGLVQGEICQPIKTPNGVHLLKVVSRENGARIVIPQLHARHILLKSGPLRDEQQTLKEITVLRQKLRAGADFAELAKKFSQDPGSAISGGDLGWFGPGKMVKAFEEQLVKLKPGQISEPFKTQFGWHIVQLLGERKKDITNEKIREAAKTRLIQQKLAVETKNWKNKIRQEAYIEYR